ncbi:MAG: hypothetical protein R2834_21885 [Rhodothermales bacterium]
MDDHNGSIDAALDVAAQEQPMNGETVTGKQRQTPVAHQRMIDWLIATPVRNTDPGQKRFGSFNHGVHEKTGRVPGQYTEITGYGVSLLAHLYRWHQEDRYLQAAREAAGFLMRIQLPSGAFPHCPDPEGTCAEGEQYTFDTSMCTMGLMDLYRADPDPAYLDSARRAGEWLMSMQREDGAFLAKFIPKTGTPNTGNFFGDGSCIHVKNAMALLKIADVTGEAAFDEAARRVCDYTLGLQASDGLFWAMPTKDFVFTHAHSYACEGFLSAGAYTGDDRYTQAALRGIRWLQQSQNADGSVYQVYADRRGVKHQVRRAVDAFKAADATSQTARLSWLAGAGFETNYRRAISFIESQMWSPQGGLYYTKGRFRTNKMMFAWPAMFAIEAFEFPRNDVSPKDLF